MGSAPPARPPTARSPHPPRTAPPPPPCSSAWSLVGPDWLALLDEGLQALDCVARRHELVQIDGLGRRHELAERRAPRPDRRALHHPQGRGATLTERRERLLEGSVGLGFRDDATDEADAQRFFWA